jgi:hypothetical protein
MCLNPGHTLAYLIFRLTTLGSLAAFVLYIGFKVTISSFDQSLRFTKRKMGTIFLAYLYARYSDKIEATVTLDQIMHSFETWNKTVESAFANVKTDAHTSANINIKPPDTKH